MDLPFLTDALPGTGGTLREEIEDFVVEERPLYPALGVGDHVYLRIEKRGITTHEAVRRVARAVGVAPRDVGYAGLKDARAIAVQTLSIEHVTPARAAAAFEGVPGVRLLDAALHRNKLRLGHLAGNRFTVRLRGVGADAVSRARAVLAALTASGCPNYFGEQRFGMRGDNAATGRLLIREGLRAASAAVDEDLARRPRAILRLLVSAYQSELFNRLLAARVGDLGRLQAGDLAYLHDRGAVFRVDDPEREQPRADALEISPSAPLYGTKSLLAEGRAGEAERALLAEESLSLAAFRVRGVGEFAGERRPMRMPITDGEVRAVEGDPSSLEVRFDLPRGAYATVVLREVTKSPERSTVVEVGDDDPETLGNGPVARDVPPEAGARPEWR